MHLSLAFPILSLLALSQSVIGAVGAACCGLADDDFCSGAIDGSGSGKAASAGEGCGNGVSTISGRVGGKPSASDLSGCIGLTGTSLMTGVGSTSDVTGSVEGVSSTFGKPEGALGIVPSVTVGCSTTDGASLGMTDA